MYPLQDNYFNEIISILQIYIDKMLAKTVFITTYIISKNMYHKSIYGDKGVHKHLFSCFYKFIKKLNYCALPVDCLLFSTSRHEVSDYCTVFANVRHNIPLFLTKFNIVILSTPTYNSRGDFLA